MAKYKINFKDSNVQYVEKYYAGESGMPVTIYYTEGDEVTPKKYFATVGVKSVEGADIDEIKKNIDKAVNERAKQLAKVNDSKKIKDSSYTKQEVIDAVIEAYGFNKKEANDWYKKASEGAKEAVVEGFKQNAKKSFYNDSKKIKDSYGEWDYEINCEGNQWTDGGFDSEEEAEDEAIAKVNDLLARSFPVDYAIDDFDITIMNNETGESYIYDAYTDIRDSKIKDAKIKDASAEEIIDLFEEAYIKGRSWDWLKNKLPKTFLELQGHKNKSYNGYDLFPIQADRTGYIEGVNLTKPKNLAENYTKEISEFVEALGNYRDLVNNIDAEYTPVDTYKYYSVEDVLNKAIKETDSKSESAELEAIKEDLSDKANVVYSKANKIPSLWFSYSDTDKYVNDYNKLGEKEFTKKLIKNINSSDRNKDYKKNQKEPIIFNREGNVIRSDSKVGPLSEEAKDYIRRVMGSTTTEDIEAKREARKRNWNDPYDYYRVNRREDLPQYSEEIKKLKDLLWELKQEARKEKRMDISVNNREHGHYKYTGKGHYDWNGRYKNNGGYEWSNETVPTSVSIDIQGLNKLSTALEQILNSGSVAEVERNLQQALEVVKTLPRNNPKVAKLKAQIEELLENRKNAPKKRRPLPDKKFRDSKKKRFTDGFSYKELSEYISLCKKLGLETAGQIEKFAKDHGNVTGKELLEVLRKEANK